MDSDQGKLFIGGISWETTEEKLRDHFGNYGHVLETVIMKDKLTGRPRGFGFVVFADPSVLDRVLQDTHTLDGRTVEAKRALSREEHHTSGRSGNPCAGKMGGSGGGGGGGSNTRTKKIFVGGLPPTLTEDEFRQYFENYGEVTDVVVMYDQNTQRPRGFGFISFDTEDAVDRVLHKTFHELNGKMVEVKRALPKDANTNTGGGGGSRSGGGGSYQSYGGSGSNSSGAYDANRHAQPQGSAAAYPTYGSSGYGAPTYGYGAANSGAGYGGYGVGVYGGSTGGYAVPSAATAGYVSGPPGAPRSAWNNQAPTGYGGNVGYGAAPVTGQSPNGNTGYGNQGYGYGGYGGGEGSYGNQGGYGAVMGRGAPANNPSGGPGEQGSGSGYGYGDAWRSDPSQGGGYGGQAGYGGGGYGGAQARQAQQQ